jgi:hypothetical protein
MKAAPVSMLSYYIMQLESRISERLQLLAFPKPYGFSTRAIYDMYSSDRNGIRGEIRSLITVVFHAPCLSFQPAESLQG